MDVVLQVMEGSTSQAAPQPTAQAAEAPPAPAQQAEVHQQAPTADEPALQANGSASAGPLSEKAKAKAEAKAKAKADKEAKKAAAAVRQNGDNLDLQKLCKHESQSSSLRAMLTWGCQLTAWPSWLQGCDWLSVS